MRKMIFLAVMLISVRLIAQPGPSGPFYVVAKGGISLREKKDAKSKLIVTIPYGAKLSLNYPDEISNIRLDGIEGAWAKTTYNGKTGYVANVYLIPWMPPKATVQTLKQYLAQVSPANGAPVMVKNGNMESIESNGSTLKKQLFKNGAEYHEETFYEANNNSYFLPGFSIEEGFLLLRLIPEFKDIFSSNSEFPTESKTIKRGDSDLTIKVESMGEGENKIVTRISIEYSEGASYEFEMFLLGGQLVINFGGGV